MLIKRKTCTLEAFLHFYSFLLDRPMVVATNVYQYFIAIDILCGTASILSLVAISLERMFAVKFPTKHFNLNSLPVYCGIVVTWVVGITLTAAKFAVKTMDHHRIYTATIFTLDFMVPLFIILMSYCMIFFAAVKMMKATNQHGTLARELHIAKTISVIIALFMFCWTPFFILNMLSTFCENKCGTRNHTWLFPVAKIMHYSNSMMNFFVYAVRSPDFRRSFKAIMLKCDTSSLKQRVRTISETITTRSRAASERTSFVHDNNNSGDTESPSMHHIRILKSRMLFKQTRLSNHSQCTDISLLDEPCPNLSANSNNSNNPLLCPSYNTNCTLEVSNHNVSFSDDVSTI